jgi:hypothetical protein
MGENQDKEVSYTSVPNRDNSFMLYRLNTDSLTHQLRITLSGKREDIYQDEKGNIVTTEVDLAEELLNKEGQNYIINWFQGIVNSSCVQANLKEDVYWNSVASYREQIATFLFINFNSWQVKEHTFDLIVESILNTIRLFITRTIDNKERESYGEVYKEISSQQSGGRYKL